MENLLEVAGLRNQIQIGILRIHDSDNRSQMKRSFERPRQRCNNNNNNNKVDIGRNTM
jgi:hypothetical protein